jgi:hypothetical protein
MEAAMFDSFSRSWALIQASWAVLRADKELVVFPIVSMIGMVIVTILFAVPALAAGIFDSALQGGRNGGYNVASIVVGFLFYVVVYTVIFFFNTALVGAALIRLDGGNPTLSDGLSIAREHAVPILGYAIIAATVGTILNALSRRAGIVGQIVISIIGFAWNIATFLVVPVLVVERLGPIDAIKRSGQLLKTTWGEQLTGNFSISGVFFLIGIVLAFVVGVPLMAIASAADSTALIVLAVAIFVLILVAVGILSSTLTGIFTAALYRFATQGTTGGFFEDSLVRDAFRRK